MAYDVRFDKKTRAMFNVPCLTVDLAKDGTAPPGLVATFLIFQTIGSEKMEAPLCSLAPPLARGGETATSVEGPGSLAADATESNPPLPPSSGAPSSTNEKHSNFLRPKLLPLPKDSTVYPSPSGSKEGVAHVALLVGGVISTVGLNPDVVVDFCTATKKALTEEYGSTWHVVLGVAVAGAPKQVAQTKQEKAAPGASQGQSSVCAVASKSSTSATKSARVYTEKELLGATFVDKDAHSSGVAPPRCVPGSFVEIDIPLQSVSKKAGKNHQHSPEKGSSGDSVSPSAPAIYRITLFQTSPGWGEEEREVGGGSLMGPLAKKPLVAARLIAYALAFVAFLSYTLLTFAHDNSCAREGLSFISGVQEGGKTNEFGGSSIGFFHTSASLVRTLLSKLYHCLDCFHWDPLLAHASLNLPLLNPDESFSLKCSTRSIVLAELRVARGKVLLFASLLLIMLSILVIRPASLIHSSMKTRAVISQISRASALEAVGRVGKKED